MQSNRSRESDKMKGGGGWPWLKNEGKIGPVIELKF